MIADDLRELLDHEDGRGIVEMRESEPSYDVVVEGAVYDKETDRTVITFDKGTGTSLKGEIKVGDTVTFWDGSDRPLLGGWRHGWAVNGELKEWLTPFERVARRVASLAEGDRKNRERIDADADERREKLDSLPEILQRRLARFERENPGFWLHGDYELFCCTEAAKFAERATAAVQAGDDDEEVAAFFEMPKGDGPGKRDPNSVFGAEYKTAEARWMVWAWAIGDRTYDYDFKRQKALLDLDPGHSGNTFGGACWLAVGILEGTYFEEGDG